MKIKDIVVVIVTFRSQNVIFKCLKYLKAFKKILILDNSNDKNLKIKIEKKFKNLKVYLSNKNLGYAGGNNFLLKKVKTKYALILNPDAFIFKNDLKKLIQIKKTLPSDFGIFGEKNGAKILKKRKNNNTFFECEYVKGFFMLVNLLALKKINYFDDNFFMYMEEIDLCKRLREIDYKIYSSNMIKIRHIGEGSSLIGFEFEKNRNWHWMWSQFYFDKKHFGYFFSFKKYFIFLIKNLFKLLLIFFNYRNRIYIYKLSGLISSMLNKRSYYRPKICQ